MARIAIQGLVFTCGDYDIICASQAAQVRVNGQVAGSIEIGYVEEKPESDEGPFLKEERSLLEEVARQVSLILEHQQDENDKLRLYEQLRHADRLATVGILAAGVAHELNEPLGNILGFAQLAKKCEGVPESAKRDIGKIETASLHGRDIVRKLLVFARQMPAEKRSINLNDVIQEGLCLLDDRCAREGIELVRALTPDLPPVVADAGQMNQVIVNLVVNALQAMQEAGGRITVRTESLGRQVLLTVEDTGTGMSKAVLDQIFMPFFTTKDVGHGTGLGLPVVYGIITGHGGSIRVDSKVGHGTRFEILLPATDAASKEN
ncbi:MAG TPA: ATP-binding protein [Sedimentisphaerales bacterium]|nr:ATP-binding protein [Sedimentisphaerales bacterium]